jgi:flagella basal body P-ring formation protein FlgA
MAMIRVVIALATLMLLGRAAFAADTATPRLKELVTVTSELVRIGDLVENAGGMADIPVFRAPDLGQTGSVAVARIAEALRPFDVTGFEADGFNEVIVTRLSRAITAKEIMERIARAVSGRYGYGDAANLAVMLDRDIRILHVEAVASAELAVTRLSLEPRSGRFDIGFEIPGSAAARRLPLRFTGTVTETVEAATLTRALRAGEVIKASDVSVERRPKSEVGHEAMTADQAIGLSVKSAVRSGVALRADNLMRPQVVQRNESVTLFYQVPGISLTVRGKALEAGAIGDLVSVLNTQSNRTLQATVIGPGRLSIGSVMPIVASAVTPSDDDPTPRTQ